MTTYSNERLAEMIVDLERRLAAANRSRQLGSSSFFGGPNQSVDVLDPATGLPVASYGTQYDGTQGAIPLSSPKPPTPTTPTAVAGPARAIISWDGFWLSDYGVRDETVVAPLGFNYVEIHASQDPAFAADAADTLTGTFGTPRGGAVTIALPAGEWFVRLVARTTAGRPSDASPAASLTVPDLVDTTELQADLVTARDDIAAAEQRLDAAEGELDLAFTTLNQVPADIAAAEQAAVAAAATDATTKADAAKQAALEVVGLKGEVITQTSAPTGTRAAPQNLWIRLPDNKPHRWNPDSALVNKWEAITDQAAIDAATAAATAQSRADAAHALATTASSTATAALTSANGKNRIIRSLTAATAAGAQAGTTAGDVWWQYDDNTYRLVVGQWTWDGDSWEVQKQGHQTIASVDIGALTVVGTATISDLVAARIAARTASIQQADIANLIVTGPSTLADVVAEQIAADTGKFMYLEAGQINVNQLWADLAFSNQARTHLLSVLTNSDGSGYTSTITGQGLRVQYTVKDETGAVVDVQDIIRVGTFGQDYIGVSDNKGNVLASIDATGTVAGKTIEASDNLRYRGVELQDTLEKVGAGVYNWGPLDYGAFEGASQLRIGALKYYGVASVDYITSGNRMTKIIFTTPKLSFSMAGGESKWHIKMRITDAADTTPITEANSATFTDFVRTNPGAGAWHDHQFIISRPIGTIDAGKRVQILIMAIAGPTGYGGYMRVFGEGNIIVEDAGELPMSTSVVKNGGGGAQWASSTTTAPAPAPVASKTRRAEAWNFSAVRSYLGTNATYAYSPGKGYQGLQPYTANGNLKSMWLFPDFMPWISGSTIEKIEVFMHFDWWNYGDGGTARIHLHGANGSLPSTYPGATFVKSITGWGINSGRWFEIPSSFFAGFLSGAYRGIALAGDGTLRTYGYASNCRIRITYTK